MVCEQSVIWWVAPKIILISWEWGSISLLISISIPIPRSLTIRENIKYLLLTSVFDQLPRSIFARDKLCFRACVVISPPDRRFCPRIL